MGICSQGLNKHIFGGLALKSPSMLHFRASWICLFGFFACFRTFVPTVEGGVSRRMDCKTVHNLDKQVRCCVPSHRAAQLEDTAGGRTVDMADTLAVLSEATWWLVCFHVAITGFPPWRIPEAGFIYLLLGWMLCFLRPSLFFSDTKKSSHWTEI